MGRDTDFRWVRSDIGPSEINVAVAALNCGLKATWWEDQQTADWCQKELGVAPAKDGQGNILIETLPFDLARAHGLYKLLLRDVEDIIRDKELLLVAPGTLSQIPLHVLVTETPVTGMLYQTRQRPRAGFEMAAIPEELRKQYKMSPGVGVAIRPIPGGPADTAGLRLGDAILSANGRTISDPGALYQLIGNSSRRPR